jgi:uncharacterized protein YdcH (DUF465 family)
MEKSKLTRITKEEFMKGTLSQLNGHRQHIKRIYDQYTRARARIQREEMGVERQRRMAFGEQRKYYTDGKRYYTK